MALSVLSHANYSVVLNSTTGFVSVSVPAGCDLVVVAIEHYATGTDSHVSNVTLGSAAATTIGSTSPLFGDTTQIRRTSLWWVRPSTSGANQTLTITLDATSYAYAAVVCFKGSSTFGEPLRIATATNSGTGVNISGIYNPSLDPNYLVVGMASVGDTSSTTAITATGAGHTLLEHAFDGGRLNFAVSTIQAPNYVTYTLSASKPWCIMQAVVVPAPDTASKTITFKTPTVITGSLATIFVDAPLFLGTVRFISASYAVVRETRTTITDMSQNGRWVSLELSREGDNSDFEVHLVDLDVRFRGRRVWRDI